MKKVVLGVTGCIGAYKAPDLVRALRKRDLRVQVILTRAAREFVSPLSLATVSGEPVLEHLFPDAGPGETAGEGPDPAGGVRHISLTEETDVFLVAPATAHVIARMALGLADDFLTTFHLAVRAPILIAPAMNTNMLAHEATRGHLRTLRERGATIIEPGEGELACGWLGPGRLAEIPDIVEAVGQTLEETATRQDLADRKVVVAAGPTREPIDPVRYLTNRSSGRMGFELAEVAAARGAEVTLVLGPTDLEPPPGHEVVRVETAREMRDRMFAAAPEADAVIMAAAVADFRPAHNSGSKLKSTGLRRENATSSLSLVANPDILGELGAARAANSGSGPDGAGRFRGRDRRARRRVDPEAHGKAVRPDRRQPGGSGAGVRPRLHPGGAGREPRRAVPLREPPGPRIEALARGRRLRRHRPAAGERRVNPSDPPLLRTP